MPNRIFFEHYAIALVRQDGFSEYIKEPGLQPRGKHDYHLTLCLETAPTPCLGKGSATGAPSWTAKPPTSSYPSAYFPFPHCYDVAYLTSVLQAYCISHRQRFEGNHTSKKRYKTTLTLNSFFCFISAFSGIPTPSPYP
jgi:hypothetical protein